MDQGRDSRLQQHQHHSFPQNTTSSYAHSSFPPPAQNRTPFSAPPHSQPVSYSDPNRRPSEPYYKQQQRPYVQEAPTNHVRHQIGTPISHGIPAHLSLPHPSSPQQHVPPPPATRQNYAHTPSRPQAGPVAPQAGPPTNFPGTREHPSLPPLGGNRAGGMAIADILGGPSTHEPTSQYNSPVNSSGPMFVSTHTSSCTNSSRPDFHPQYQRSQTPELPRKIETRDSRDNRVNSASSPSGLSRYATPELHRFEGSQNMPQPYLQRGISHEERKDTTRKINLNAPPRPNSQPNSYSIPPPHDSDRPPIHLATVLNRRVEQVQRTSDTFSYGRPAPEELDRHKQYTIPDRDRAHEQQHDQEIAIQRERKHREDQEQKERAEQENKIQRDYALQAAQRKVWYHRPPEARDWMQQGAYEMPRPAYEPIPEREVLPPRHQTSTYEFPASTAPQFVGPAAYAPIDHRNEHRYVPPGSLPPQVNSIHDTTRQEREGVAPQQLTPYSNPSQNISQYGSYQAQESQSRKLVEESQTVQQRNFLGVQEINRKGRISPLPQAVQGAQVQVEGPGGEPSIKNEFGRMFSGIGSGVGSVFQAPGTIAGQNHSTTPSVRREDLENPQESQTVHESQVAVVQGSKRRKIKEEDKVDDETPTGRNTPSKRVKRTKTHQHHHIRPVDPVEPQSPSQQNSTPLKNVKSSSNSHQDSDNKQNTNLHHHHHHHHHHVSNRHHHHTSATTKGSTSSPSTPNHTLTALPKLSIHNDAVLTSVANYPRHHLGHGYYCSTLKTLPNSNSANRDANCMRGFASTPQALPLFTGRENCTYTVKIPRIYLEDSVREEVTSRKAIWGTDIYTDDSDVLAACIHAGWFRGAWSEDVDVDLLGLELKSDDNGNPVPPDEIQLNQLLESPSEKGPGYVPLGYDCHVTVLILPLLDRYSSSTRFGIKSREWGVEREGWKGKHDGLSFMIKSIRFVSGVDGEEGRSGRSRCKILKRQLQEKEENYTNSPLVNGNLTEMDNHVEISYERTTGRLENLGAIKGLGLSGWWKRNNSNVLAGKEEETIDKTQLIKPQKSLSPPLAESDSKSLTDLKIMDPSETASHTPTSPSLASRIIVTSPQRRKFICQITDCMRRNANYYSSRPSPIIDILK